MKALERKKSRKMGIINKRSMKAWKKVSQYKK
jgi:hypothetical protein